MTFLVPALLFALPLAALPVLIHLIHLYRRRQVKWAAMMFLLAAQRMNKGLSRLRQVLILALRVLALAALLFVLTRPLAGGWLGLTGGAPDTVLVLLDRSASMEQLNPATGQSKRTAGLGQLAKAITDAVGTRSRLVLIDSALRQPLPLSKAQSLNDLPQTEATATTADLPALLQSALDFITTNKTGRTDVWMLSDLQRADWDASSGRWAILRAAFAALPGVRFHLLAYPEPAPEDLAVTVERVVRRETADKAELLLDLRITRHAEHPQPVELPLRLVVNGAATVLKASLRENQLLLQAQAVPLDKAVKRGWGRVELPADAGPADNVSYFVFDEPAPLRSVIVTDDPAEAGPWKAALSAARRSGAAVCGHRPPARAGPGDPLGGNRAAGLAGAASGGGQRSGAANCRNTWPPGGRSFSCRWRSRGTKRFSASIGPSGPGSRGARRRGSSGGATMPICWPTPAMARRCRSARWKSPAAAASRAKGWCWRAWKAARRCSCGRPRWCRETSIFSARWRPRAPPPWPGMAWCCLSSRSGR